MKTMKFLVVLLMSTLFLAGCTSASEKRQNAKAKCEEAVKLYSNALVFLQLENETLEKIISLLDESINIDPSYAEPYAKKANMLSKLGRDEEGLAVLNKAMEKIGNKDIELLIQRVIIYEKKGQTELAIQDYKTLIEVFNEMLEKDSADFYALTNRAVVIGLSEGLENGLKELEKIPDNNLEQYEDYQLKFLKKSLKNNSREEIVEKMDII